MNSARTSFANRGLARPASEKVLGGVAAGLARRFGVSTTLVRLAFIISIVLPGPQVLLYLVLWVLMPSDADAR
jgi:phage shock protein PspC (stress-responsive transcriptional regulator)